MVFWCFEDDGTHTKFKLLIKGEYNFNQSNRYKVKIEDVCV